MATLHVDFSAKKGRIKQMNGVGQPPLKGNDTSYYSYLSEADIPCCRLHDTGGYFGGSLYVDIPNIFRDFDADENDPASYDFVFTDHYLKGLYDRGIEIIYRLGVTIENYHKMKAFRIFPPKDFGKWARVCEHIIRHYNEGWANGFTFGIRYWEIWNEPDLYPDPADNSMWKDTPEQYFECYDVTAKHLKSVFGDKISVGGYASCGGFGTIFTDPVKYGVNAPAEAGSSTVPEPVLRHRLQFFFDFLGYIKAHGSPLDFFSWHNYSKSPDRIRIYDEFVHRTLASYGYGNVVTILDEWNNAHAPEMRGTSYACARAAAMMLTMQESYCDILNYYDARLERSEYGGLFSPATCKPYCTYYAFKAFGKLLKLGTQVVSEITGEGLYAVAAVGEDGKRAVMLANIGAEAQRLSTDLPADLSAIIIDEERPFSPAPLDPADFVIGTDEVILFEE